MTYDRFMGLVQHRAHLANTGEAERATRAVLETLGERLAGGEPFDLASQLPPEIGRHLEHDYSGAGERFSLEGFYQLVSLREGTDLPEAIEHAQAVISVLNDAVSPGEMKDVRAQLPAEYDMLFEAGGEGAIRPAE